MRGDPHIPSAADVVIAGGGFAGAASAWALAEAGAGNVLLLEAEDQPGKHASGLNASMLRQLVPDPVLGAMLRASAAQVRSFRGAPAPVDVRVSGSLLLLGGGEEGAALLAAAGDAAAAGLPCKPISRDEAVARVAPLSTAAFDRAIRTDDDGVVDVHALLWHYLRVARAGGAVVVTGCPVTGVEAAGGRVRAVETPFGRVACRVLVNAAGAWANEVAGLAGLDPLPMTPFRRHLAVTPPLDFVEPAWPFVWHPDAGWYFRPEVGGLLLCACDQDPAPPGPAVRDPSALELLASRLASGVPALAQVAIRTWWAGLRTIASDGRFVIGEDPRLSGFFWVAGLGGHGMTGSAVAGRVAAALVTGRQVQSEWRESTSPGRFL